jgi:hypothetical protein
MPNPSISRVLLRHGGIARMAEFLAAGLDPEEVRISRNYGKLTMIRKGWYCRPGVHPAVIAAVRVGGRLACVSAIAYHDGGDNPPQLHVALPPGAARPRDPENHRRRLTAGREVVLHWTSRPLTGDRAAVAREVARRQAETCAAVTAATP